MNASHLDTVALESGSVLLSVLTASQGDDVADWATEVVPAERRRPLGSNELPRVEKQAGGDAPPRPARPARPSLIGRERETLHLYRRQ